MEQLDKGKFHGVFWLLDSSDRVIESEKVTGSADSPESLFLEQPFDFHVTWSVISLLVHVKGPLTDPGI